MSIPTKCWYLSTIQTIAHAPLVLFDFLLSGGGAFDIRVVAPRTPPTTKPGGGRRVRKGVLHVGITDTYPVTFHVPGAKKNAKKKLEAMSQSM